MNLPSSGSRIWSCLIQIGLSAFFLLFGVDLLLSAYSLESPQYFVLTFFASNLVILISAVVLIGGVLRWVRGERKEEETETSEETPAGSADSAENPGGGEGEEVPPPSSGSV